MAFARWENGNWIRPCPSLRHFNVFITSRKSHRKYQQSQVMCRIIARCTISDIIFAVLGWNPELTSILLDRKSRFIILKTKIINRFVQRSCCQCYCRQKYDQGCDWSYFWRFCVWQLFGILAQISEVVWSAGRWLLGKRILISTPLDTSLHLFTIFGTVTSSFDYLFVAQIDL